MAIQYYTATSVDGYIADADNSLDWLFACDTGGDTSYDEFIADVGALVMGATTYQWILDNHIAPDAGKPQPWPYQQPCWVFTHRDLRRIDGAEIRFVQGNPAEVYPDLASAAGDQNIWLVGGGELVGQFHDHGLLDEVILSVAPVTLGSGAPLLPRMITGPRLELTQLRQTGEFAMLSYRVRR
jgi:dihydrofolate reductase